MSWDVYVKLLPPDAISPSDVPDDYESPPLGSRNEIRAKIQEAAPSAEFETPNECWIEDAEYTIEIDLGDEEVCTEIAFLVHGGGDAPKTVAKIVDHLGFRAIDAQTGEYFSLEDAEASFAQWQAFRDHVIGNQGDGSRESPTAPAPQTPVPPPTSVQKSRLRRWWLACRLFFRRRS